MTKGIHPKATNPTFHERYIPMTIPHERARILSKVAAIPSILAPFKQDISLARTFVKTSGEFAS